MWLFRLAMCLMAIGAGMLWQLFLVGQPDTEEKSNVPIPSARPDPDWKGGYICEMEFPTDRDKKETAWKIHWYVKQGLNRENFVIREAWFKPNLQKDWIKILGSTYMAEINVAYASGLRYYDIKQQEFELSTALPEEHGPFGKILDKEKKVVGEIRTRGVLWKHEDKVRRGSTLLLWATLQAGNYDYLMEYGFQDDGAITMKMGSTGQNLLDSPWEAHTHNGFWHIDIDLGGKSPNTVYVTDHQETPEMKGKSLDFVDAFNKGVEGFADWNPRKFTKLLIANKEVKNANNHFLSYLLVPCRMGTARHFGGKDNITDENFTHHDFWVTKHNPKEDDYSQIEKYVGNKEPIKDTNVVLWTMASAYHIPRDEDFVDGRPATALTMWCGFTLHPRNLFDRTPFFP